jgi:TetR/AcrR family transcriptional repressor of nem operon
MVIELVFLDAGLITSDGGRIVGVSKEQAAENRRAIIAAAGSLFRERGVAGVGLAELMSQAGFTQGGFYNHFASKEALVAEVVAAAMTEGGEDFAARQQRPLPSSKSALKRHVDYYLSEGHRDDLDHGCPVAGFAGDAPRFGDEARAHYAAGVQSMIAMIEGLIVAGGGKPKPKAALRERATRVYCEMAGALLLSRSLRGPAPELAKKILEACRRGLADI